LQRGYLEVLQVFVASDTGDRREIFEAYTYMFQYSSSRLTTVQIGETSRVFSVIERQKSFKAAIRALLRVMKMLPRLPSVSLFCYTSSVSR
jgi:hypothetical protein